MTHKIGKYEFGGPYSLPSTLYDTSGVYAILCYRDGKYDLLDVGESANMRTRVENHDRKDCWQRNCRGGELRYAEYPTPHLQQAGRMKIEQEIREQYDPRCGKA